MCDLLRETYPILKKMYPSHPWACINAKAMSEPFKSAEDAIEAALGGRFAHQGGLAVFQSGICAFDMDPPDNFGALGPVLQLELYADGETRTLRYVGGSTWRLTTISEGAGETYLAEDLAFIGDREAGHNDPGVDPRVDRLFYRKYWSLEPDGGWVARHARLIGLDLHEGL